MATALRLRPNTLPLPAMPAPVDPLQLLPDYARAEAERCLGIIRPALIRVQQGVSVRGAAEWLATSAEGMPSATTLRRWLRDYIQGGIVELAPKYQGRQRKARGWEAKALEYFNRPQWPSFGTAALWLRQDGYTNVNAKAVERYIKASPAHLGTLGKKRLGPHYYAQNVKPHVVRDNTVLPVGFVYQGDGHCCDVYVQHPAKGHFRPELTVWIDVRSHYVVGWWISESESAQTTLFSLSRALLDHDHVPAYVHTDPGSGFKARMISDTTAGFLAKFHIRPMLALPGNARGKGLVEGWFRWFEERLGKRFDSFCGHCRTDDALSRLETHIKRGAIKLPTLEQYIEAIRGYIDFYNTNPQKGLGDKAPADLWSDLERVALETPGEAVLRPREECSVRKSRIRLDNRLYESPRLEDYNGHKVLVEYSIHDDERVWVLDEKGRQIAEAALVLKEAWMPASRIEEAQQKRLEGQRQRRAARDAIDDSRARLPISASAMLDALDAPANDAGAAIAAPRDAMLDQQHSVLVPPAAPEIQQRLRPVTAAAQQRVVELIADAEAPTETPEQRFARALQLETHGCATDADATWLRHYQRSAEYYSRRDLYDEFNAL